MCERRSSCCDYELEVELELGDERVAAAIFAALKPEAEQFREIKERKTTEITITVAGSTLRAAIRSSDLGDLRAVANSLLYLMQSALSSLKAASASERVESARGRGDEPYIGA